MTINIQYGCRPLILSSTSWALQFRLARIAPYAFPFRRMLAISPPSWQHLRLMYAFRDSDGKILASCAHFKAQSGDSECVARESCRQGLLFASRCPKSCMAHDSCHGDCPPRGPRAVCAATVPVERLAKRWLAPSPSLDKRLFGWLVGQYGFRAVAGLSKPPFRNCSCR